MLTTRASCSVLVDNSFSARLVDKSSSVLLFYLLTTDTCCSIFADNLSLLFCSPASTFCPPDSSNSTLLFVSIIGVPFLLILLLYLRQLQHRFPVPLVSFSRSLHHPHHPSPAFFDTYKRLFTTYVLRNKSSPYTPFHIQV